MDPLRKRFFGDTAAAQHYIGPAVKLLGQVKHQMGFNSLQQLSRQVVLAGGVVLFAHSAFGQDEIRVYVPPAPAAAGGGAPARPPRWVKTKTVLACVSVSEPADQTVTGYLWREQDDSVTPIVPPPPPEARFSVTQSWVGAVSAQGEVTGWLAHFDPNPSDGDTENTTPTPWVWTEQGGTVLLDTTGLGNALSISYDGTTIAGHNGIPYGEDGGFLLDACIWVRDEHGSYVRESLGVSGWQSSATDVSADGRVVVGWLYYFSGEDVTGGAAWRWTRDKGAQILAAYDSGIFVDQQVRVSGDGSAVGWWVSNLGGLSYWWTERSGVVAIEGAAVLTGLSYTGATAYGYTLVSGTDLAVRRPFRWWRDADGKATLQELEFSAPQYTGLATGDLPDEGNERFDIDGGSVVTGDDPVEVYTSAFFDGTIGTSMEVAIIRGGGAEPATVKSFDFGYPGKPAIAVTATRIEDGND